jgi:transcriptional regulator with XRE-family HTH domain
MKSEPSSCAWLTREPFAVPGFDELVAPLLNVDVAAAMTGDVRAVHGYVAAWQNTRRRLLFAVTADCPGLVLPPLLESALDREALQAPFSAWMVTADPHRGLALDLVARLRGLLWPEATPLLPDSSAARSVLIVWSRAGAHEHARTFYREAVAALEGRRSPVLQIQQAYGLKLAEVARLFGVRRQAVDQWVTGELPAERRAKAATVLAVADLLQHRLKPGRLPGVARKQAHAYGGLSMLEMIAADRHEELLATVRASFDFAQTA